MKIGKIKKLVFFVVVLILLMILGVFLWKDENPDIGLVRFEEFTVEETSEGKIIRHEETGLEITIPVDWNIEDGGNNFYYTSPDFEVDKENSDFYFLLIPQKGCSFNASVNRGLSSDGNHNDYDYVLDTINLCSDDDLRQYCDYDLIKIEGEIAIEHVSAFNNENILGNHIIARVAKNYNEYVFEALLFGENREKCEDEFNKILETVKIK